MGCIFSKSVEVVNTTQAPASALQPLPNTKPHKKYKLTYFDVTGRGELTRLIFKATKTDFEDERIKQEELENFKSNSFRFQEMPLGQVPILQVDNKPVLCQSIAIARFVAKEVGLAGKDSLEMAKIDAVVDTLSELFEEFLSKVYPEIRNPTPEKNKVVATFSKDVVLKYFDMFETLIKLYGDESTGYFVGNTLSWADLFLHEILTDLFMVINPSIMDDFKLIGRNRESVSNHPNLKEYFEKRNEIESKSS